MPSVFLIWSVNRYSKSEVDESFTAVVNVTLSNSDATGVVCALR